MKNISSYCDPDLPAHSFCAGVIPMPTDDDSALLVPCDCDCHKEEAR